MHTLATKCTKCGQKDLRCHDLMCQDTYRLHKRVKELSFEKGKNLPSSLVSAILVVAVSGLVIIGYDCYSHPDGKVANQLKALVGPTGMQSIAKTSKSTL